MKARIPEKVQRTPGWVVLVTALCACTFLIYLWSPLYGDDLGYKREFGGPMVLRGSWLEYPLFAARHWFICNGRLIDKLMPAAMNLPGGIRALLCAVALWGMYYFSVRATGRGRGFVPYLLIAAIALVLPWWDSAFVFAVQLNYVWASALLMLAFGLIFGKELGSTLLRRLFALAICFFAGMSHEGGAVPMAFGLAAFFIIRREIPSGTRGARTVAFFAGLMCTVLSPALRHRVHNPLFTPNDTVPWLILKSEPAVLVLWGIILVCLITPKSRRFLLGLSREPQAVLTYATLAGAPIIIASGIVGRTGWFVTLYALIAMAWMLSRLSERSLPGLQWAISLLLLAQAAGEAWIQYGLDKEYKDYEARFLASPDGVFEGDYTMDDELPFWTINRLRGVPEADDYWLIESLGAYSRPGDVFPVLIGPRTRFVDELPAGAKPVPDTRVKLWIAEKDGVEYIYTPARGRYAEDRRFLDPGDR